MKNVTNWVFWYDQINNQWRAAKRENHRELFNNFRSDLVLKSSNIDTLIDIINKTNGDPKLMKDVLQYEEK